MTFEGRISRRRWLATAIVGASVVAAARPGFGYDTSSSPLPEISATIENIGVDGKGAGPAAGVRAEIVALSANPPLFETLENTALADIVVRNTTDRPVRVRLIVAQHGATATLPEVGTAFLRRESSQGSSVVGFFRPVPGDSTEVGRIIRRLSLGPGEKRSVTLGVAWQSSRATTGATLANWQMLFAESDARLWAARGWRDAWNDCNLPDKARILAALSDPDIARDPDSETYARFHPDAARKQWLSEPIPTAPDEAARFVLRAVRESVNSVDSEYRSRILPRIIASLTAVESPGGRDSSLGFAALLAAVALFRETGDEASATRWRGVATRFKDVSPGAGAIWLDRLDLLRDTQAATGIELPDTWLTAPPQDLRRDPMASLLDISDVRFHGPKRTLTHFPRQNSTDLRAPFVGPEGVGSIVFRREAENQRHGVRVAYGIVRLRRLTVALAAGFSPANVLATVDGQPIEARLDAQPGRAIVDFDPELTLKSSQSLYVSLL